MGSLKKYLTIFVAFSATSLSSCGGRLVSQQPLENNNGSAGKNQLIIKRKIPDFESNSLSTFSKHRIKSINKLGVEVIQVPPDISVKEYMREIASDPTVEYVEPNYIRRIAMLDPIEDAKFSNDILDNQNLLQKNDSTKRPENMFNDPNIKQQYGLISVNAAKAWGVSTGSEKVIVAVIDTGVDLEHPDLKGNLVKGFTTVKGIFSPNDDNGHGTHVSGIVAALSNNSTGISGLAPKCKIMPIKVLSGKGEGNDSDIAEGIIWSVDHGANIINLSLGGGGSGKTLENAMTYAYKNNVLVIAAMGNNGSNVKTYPAAYKNVIAVAATDSKNKVAPFSNYGEWVSVSAPGLKIYSTFPTYKVELSRYNIDTTYGTLSGTSMATPYVAGLAALIYSKNPSMNRSDVRKKIEQYTLDIDKKGFDDFSGTGLIDAYKSLVN